MEYESRSGSTGELLVSGHSVQVMFDYDAQQSMTIPDELRRRLQEFDNPA